MRRRATPSSGCAASWPIARLAELSIEWNGVPFKEAILRVPAKRLRGRAYARGQGSPQPIHRPGDARGRAAAEGAAEPADSAGGLDERAVEMPLALTAAALDRPGEVLDAGSALNLPLVRAHRPAARMLG